MALIYCYVTKNSKRSDESIIMIEEEMHVKKKCIVRYHQEFNSEESNDFDEEDQQHKPKGKK